MGIFQYIVDAAYVIAAIAIVCVFAARGFFESVFRFGRYIASALISYSFGPVLSGFLYRKWIFNFIAVPVAEKISNLLSNTIGSVDVDSMLDTLPAIMQKLVDVEALKEKYGTTVENIDGMAEDFAASVSAPLAGLLSNLIAYVSIFFLSVLLLTLLFKLLNHVFELPGFNFVNHLLGAVLGAVAALLTLAAITWVLGVFISLFGSSGKLAEFAESSKIFGFFRDLDVFKLFQSVN